MILTRDPTKPLPPELDSLEYLPREYHDCYSPTFNGKHELARVYLDDMSTLTAYSTEIASGKIRGIARNSAARTAAQAAGDAAKKKALELAKAEEDRQLRARRERAEQEAKRKLDEQFGPQ